MKKLARTASNVLPSWVKQIVKNIANHAISFLPDYIDINIDMLGIKHATDKLSHGYLQYYDAHFAPLRKKKLNIFEIGIGGYDDPKAGGASLRLWKDYFKNGQIYGLDIHDKSFHEDKRIKIFKGSQNDSTFLKEVVSKIGNIDIIIDDGSHVNEHIITSFNTLFPLLNPSGIYVIEDINTSYLTSYGGSFTNLSSESTAIGMVKSLIDSLNYKYIPGHTPTPFDGQIISIHCYPKIIFIKKGKNDDMLSTYEEKMIKSELDKMAS
jgi:hypothetical protein